MYMPFYAVYTGHIQGGVYGTWDECKREAHKKPKYKKFATREEAALFAEKGSTVDENFDIVVYTDGACSKNGKEGAKGGYGVFFGLNDPRNTSGRIVGKATNNIAELTAIIKALEILKDNTSSVGIYTDSNYAILCCTTYGAKCEKKGWVDVPNAALVKHAYELVKSRNVQLVYVPAHTGNTDPHSLGNKHADLLATSCWA